MASSSSSSPSPAKSSKLKTDTTLLSSSTHTTALECPLLFPDPVNECLCSLLESRELLNMSLVSKAVKGDYDGKVREADLYLRNDYRVTSFFAFVKRHKSLHCVWIISAEALPCFLTCMDRGQFRLLIELDIRDKLPLSCVSTLAALLEEGTLPVLESLRICSRQERSTTASIMRALQTGACPLLKGLEVGFLDHTTSVDEDGSEEMVVDEEQTERNLEAIVNALEARAAAGTCQGLQRLYVDWSGHGSVGLRTRLLRVLLPSVDTIPYLSWNIDFAMAVKEIGAPYLKRLHVTGDFPPLVDALSSMISLKALQLRRGSLGGVSLHSFIALIQRYQHNLLPCLDNLTLNHPFDDAADAKRFFETAGENKAFASAKLLIVVDARMEVEFLASAFAGGAFAGLEDLFLKGLDGTDGGFAALCQALGANSCAKTLKHLSLIECKADGEGTRALGALFAHGVLPCLETLVLKGPSINDLGALQLAEGFGAAGRPLPLFKLDINFTEMGDKGLQALLSVIESGCLPALEVLFLPRNCLSDAGIVALSQTIYGGHLSVLKSLHVGSNHMKAETACLLAKAVSTHCPELGNLGLPKLKRRDRNEIRDILKDRKDLKTHFF